VAAEGEAAEGEPAAADRHRPRSAPGRAVGSLRIVAGKLRGRRIAVPADPELRPTPERVREALFNILGQDLTGFRVLDLYAGSGALGFEALSRGANLAVFVESAPRTAAALRGIAADLGVEREARIVVARVEEVLDRRRLGGPFDVVFADPPYASDAGSTLVDRVDEGGVLGLHGTLIVERESRSPAASGSGRLERYRTAVYGRAALDFFKYLPAGGSAAGGD